MYVKTKLASSKIHGIGLFADQFVPKGTVVWKFTPGFDRKFTKKQFAKLPCRAREYLWDGNTYTSRKSGHRIFPTDNGKFFNHSRKPNTLSKYEKRRARRGHAHDKRYQARRGANRRLWRI